MPKKQQNKKEMYEAYGYIRYIVTEGRCVNLKVDEVIEQLKPKHVEKINKLFGYDETKINKILEYMKRNFKL